MVVRAWLSKRHTHERTGFLMIPKQKMKLVYGLVLYFLMVGVLCYAAFPVSPPEVPMRIMYDVTAGKVLFDHQTHTSESAYGLSCWDCHHHPVDDDAGLIACGTCHTATGDANGQPEVCLDCHDSDEIEDTEVMKRADAFHAQCIECHQDYGAGAVECAACHVIR